MITDTGHGLLHAIQEDPADDTLRLVYADWLEEQGDPRCEFIRLQLQLAPHEELLEKFYGLAHRTLENEHNVVHDVAYHLEDELTASAKVRAFIVKAVKPETKPIIDMAERQRALIERHGVEWAWAPPLPGEWECTPRSNPSYCDVQIRREGVGIYQRFRRGFVSEVTASPELFLLHAGDLFRDNPVERIGFVPNPVNMPGHFSAVAEGYTIYRGGSGAPEVIWDLLEGGATGITFGRTYKAYPYHEAAVDALNNACLEYGRRSRIL